MKSEKNKIVNFKDTSKISDEEAESLNTVGKVYDFLKDK